METPLLLGIHGVKQAGKGTAFHFVEEWASSLGLSAAERGFGDYVKWMFARIFFPGISMKDAVRWADDHKEDPMLRVVLEHRHRPHVHHADISLREAFQHFGTESGRDLLGGDFWARILLPDGQWRAREFGNAFVCGITDLRFEEEYDIIQEAADTTGCRAVFVKIRNREAEMKIVEEARKTGKEIHRSELGLPDEMFRYVINNDDSKEDLRVRVRAMMSEVHGA